MAFTRFVQQSFFGMQQKFEFIFIIDLEIRSCISRPRNESWYISLSLRIIQIDPQIRVIALSFLRDSFWSFEHLVFDLVENSEAKSICRHI